MIDIFDLWNSFQSLVNTFQGGWYRPQSDFATACSDISNELWEHETRRAEKSQEAKDNLIAFLKSTPLKVEAKGSRYGKIVPPKDYGRFAGAKMLVKGDKTLDYDQYNQLKTDAERSEEYYNDIKEVTIDLVDNLKWAACLDHTSKMPTLIKPKMKQIDGGYYVAPRSIGSMILDYYVKPIPCVFAYTVTEGNPQTGAGDQIVYDKDRSKHLQWPTTMVNEFLVRLGERYGLFTRDQFVSQFSSQQKMTA